ncbi:MAG: 2-dehydropantoate 2-reductase [Alphaproteobacteria bacterium]
MKIAMMGSGGVGGYFGARLAAAGHDVTFIARGAHLAAMKRDGLKVMSAEHGDVTVKPVQATDDPGTLGVLDVAIIAVKLWDTEAAGRAVLPMIGPGTLVISLQNGIEAEETLTPIVGAEHLAGGAAFIASAIEAPGVIKHIGTIQRIVVGELGGDHGGGITPRITGFAEACREAGIDAEASGDITRILWEKFVFLCGLSGTTTMLEKTAGPIREDSVSRRLLADIMAEVAAVGRAKGIQLPADFVEGRLEFFDGLPPEMTSSTHHDLDRGNRLEIPWLAGAVVRLGDELGVEVPANRKVCQALEPHIMGRATP